MLRCPNRWGGWLVFIVGIVHCTDTHGLEFWGVIRSTVDGALGGIALGDGITFQGRL